MGVYVAYALRPELLAGPVSGDAKFGERGFCQACLRLVYALLPVLGFVDEKLLRGRHAVRGTVKQVAGQLAEYQRFGMGHVALEVSYSVYPAILETIDVLADQVKPVLDRG